MSPCTYSVLPKSATSALMKKSVLRNAEKKPVMKPVLLYPMVFSQPRKMRPTRNPSSRRGTKRCTNARKGSMENSVAPMPLGMPMPRHCRKLSRPKTAPMAAPPAGPRAAAAMAMGMMLSVMDSGPIGIVPIGVNENTIRMAVIRPRMTRDLVLVLRFIFDFPPCYRSLRRGMQHKIRLHLNTGGGKCKPVIARFRLAGEKSFAFWRDMRYTFLRRDASC